MQLKERKTFIGGLTGSGKTTLAKKLIKKHKLKTIVYTPHPNEWIKEDVYLYDGDFLEDFEQFMKNCVKWGKQNKINLVVIDESDLLYNNKQTIKKAFLDFLINHRHYNLGLVMISRRPQNLPTQIFEEMHNMFFGAFESPNVKKKLNTLYPGLGDMIGDLDFEDHKFYFKQIGKPPQIAKVKG